jgi:AbiJ N-terminal domain 4
METEALIGGADWPLVYDIIEDLHDYIAQRQPDSLEQFQTEVNDHFRETGIGWQLVNGRIETRGPEAFEAAVRGGISALSDGGRPTASQELHEALLDLSRRPEPDCTGAVQHALAALECVARDASGDPKATLGTILERHPGLFPKPLDVAAEKVWAFASQMGRGGALSRGPGPGRGAGPAPALGPLPPRAGRALPAHRQARAGAGAPHQRDRDVPRDGHDVLAGKGGDGNVGTREMRTREPPS